MPILRVGIVPCYQSGHSLTGNTSYPLFVPASGAIVAPVYEPVRGTTGYYGHAAMCGGDVAIPVYWRARTHLCLGEYSINKARLATPRGTPRLGPVPGNYQYRVIEWDVSDVGAAYDPAVVDLPASLPASFAGGGPWNHDRGLFRVQRGTVVFSGTLGDASDYCAAYVAANY